MRLRALCTVLLLLPLATTALAIGPEVEHVVLPPDQRAAPLSPAAMRDDLQAMWQTLEAVHPDLYAGQSREQVAAAIAELSATLEEPLTRLQFASRLGRLNTLWPDGHTRAMAPTEEWEEFRVGKQALFPLRLSWAGERLRIEGVADPADAALIGAEIRAINGLDADTLQQRLLAQTGGETLASRKAYAALRLPLLLWLDLDQVSPFTVEVQRDGERLQRQVRGIDYRAWQKLQGQRVDPWRFAIVDGVGVITFNQMRGDLDDFERFLDRSFKTLAKQKIDRLILDLRGNGGGDSRFGDAFIARVSAIAHPQYQRIEVRASQPIKDYYRRIGPKGLRWLPLHWVNDMLEGVAKTPVGDTFVYTEASKPSKQQHFKGRLAVLIGPQTYSSAAMLAATLKHHELATLIGAATGQPEVFYGDSYLFDLPNSRLQVSVAHKRFWLPGASADDGNTTQPQLPVANEDGRDALLAQAMQCLQSPPH